MQTPLLQPQTDLVISANLGTDDAWITPAAPSLEAVGLIWRPAFARRDSFVSNLTLEVVGPDFERGDFDPLDDDWAVMGQTRSDDGRLEERLTMRVVGPNQLLQLTRWVSVSTQRGPTEVQTVLSVTPTQLSNEPEILARAAALASGLVATSTPDTGGEQ